MNGNIISQTLLSLKLVNSTRLISTENSIAIDTDALLIIIQEALRDNLTDVLILSDTVWLRCDVGYSLQFLLNEPRCSQHLSSEFGGVLILGTTNLKQCLYELLPQYPSLCCDNSNMNVAPIAAIFHQNTFQEILDWGAHFHKEKEHNLYYHLSDIGYIVRLANPQIFISPETQLLQRVSKRVPYCRTYEAISIVYG